MTAVADFLELPLPPPPRRSTPYVARVPMTDEEFMAWDHGNRLAEWVDGEAFIYMTTTNEHERILTFLAYLLSVYCSVTGAGVIRRGPFAMRGVPGGSIREPDLAFVAAENAHRITEARLDGPADLAIEVVSDDSPARDRRAKFREYQAAGVPEYWIIDSRPRRRKADFYVLNDGPGGQQYQAAPLTPEGLYRSTVLPELVLDPAWLWSDEQTALQFVAKMLGRERVVAALG
jgi:Uma2 family endonuclease